MNDFLACLHLESLSIISNEIRRRTDCIVNTKLFARGREHIVFELIFGDDTQWIARVALAHRFIGSGTEEFRSEVTTFQFLCHSSSLPIPRIHGYDFDPTNKFGAPYVLMDAVPGVICNRILPDIPETAKSRIYRQLARVMVELSEGPRWEKIGLLQSTDDHEYSITTMAFEGYHHTPAVCSSTEFYTQRAE